ncbi:hypothetical protein E1610_10730 [Salmonella enterica subsp. enterica serovar Muenchen]|nr:hypothetical protein [Salmonella enterica subsp. enterica serovar Muenchen]
MSENLHSDIPGIITLSNKKYAINLLWNQVDGQKPIVAAREGAKLINTGIVCINNNFLGYQYGLADKNIGHKSGMFALATKIDISKGSLCGIWEVDEKIWLVIAINRDGIIIIDKGFFHEEQAKEEFYSVVYSDEWDNIVCPESLTVNDSINVSLDVFLSKKAGKKIKSVFLSKGKKSFIFLFLICVIVIACVIFDKVKIDNSQTQVQYQPPSLTSEKKKESKPEVIKMPWSNQPEPYSMMTQCINQIDREYLNASSVPGWLWTETASCDSKSVFFPVTRSAGTKLWLRSADTLITPPPLITDVTENSAVLSWPVPDVLLYKEIKALPENLNNIKDISDFLQEAFAQSSGAIDISASSQNIAGNSMILEVNFNYNTVFDPRVFLSILSNVEGITVKEITYSFSKKEWSVSGVFYGIN